MFSDSLLVNHSLLQQCSYDRLRVGERLPEGDLHPSDKMRLQAHAKPLRGSYRRKGISDFDKARSGAVTHRFYRGTCG
jgi:hypothetical protein